MAEVTPPPPPPPPAAAAPNAPPAGGVPAANAGGGGAAYIAAGAQALCAIIGTVYSACSTPNPPARSPGGQGGQTPPNRTV